MKYQTTKTQCQKQINELGNVCDRCGMKLVPIKTEDNAGNPTYWQGCFHGNDKGMGCFTHGVKKEVYEIAYKLVLEDGLYWSMGFDGSDFEYLFQGSVSKATRLIMDVEYMKTNDPRYTKEQLKERYLRY